MYNNSIDGENKRKRRLTLFTWVRGSRVYILMRWLRRQSLKINLFVALFLVIGLPRDRFRSGLWCSYKEYDAFGLGFIELFF